MRSLLFSFAGEAKDCSIDIVDSLWFGRPLVMKVALPASVRGVSIGMYGGAIVLRVQPIQWVGLRIVGMVKCAGAFVKS